MSQAFDLSILIVNFNGGDMLRNLLASIESTRGDLAVQTIVVDNASPDASANVVETFPGSILLRNTENVGFARGNNQAARSAAGPLFLLLNNDTIVRPNAMQTLRRFMIEHPDSVAAGPKLIGADGKPQRSGRNLPTVPALLNSILFLKWTGLFRSAYRQYRREGFDPQVPGPVGQLAAAALMIRREPFEKSGGFDEGFPFGVEDVDLCRRLSQFGNIQYVPEAEIEHLGRVSSRANRGFVYRNYECGWARYLRKHHGRSAARLYKTLVTIDLPLRVLVPAIQYAIHRLLSRREKSQRSLDRVKATFSFALTGLPAFWKS
ncbi:MAG: glycosyltransferase family 2 protein [Tepidisphaeraceae bacterium]